MSKLGVIVGRFQVPALTSGHKLLIEHALKENNSLLIVVGTCHVRVDPHDPLPFEVVKDLLDTHITHMTANCEIKQVFDHPRNDAWSLNLDTIIGNQCKNMHVLPENVTLYGGRDSFIPHYLGRLATSVFESNDKSEGTEVRNSWQQKTSSVLWKLDSDDKLEAFAGGMIHAASQPFPTSFQCVDILAVTESNQLVLIEKEGHGVLQLPGGFVDVSDSSLEDAALRELKEETGLIGDKARYFLSCRVEDFRYRNRRDGIMTAAFTVNLEDTEIKYMKAGDDAFKVHAMNIVDAASSNNIMPGHLGIIQKWVDKYVTGNERK